ncbi:MAG: DUF4345 family protein [Pseudomonadota bacterium]
MLTTLNIIAAVITIALGAIGWLRPRFTMEKLGLAAVGGPFGLSEVRAVNGATFVGVGLAALLLATPTAFAMVGALYAGAALGRGTSLILENGRSAACWVFFAIEAGLAAYLLAANLG